MDGLTLTLWVAVGAFVGGVVTPVVAEDKRINTWLATAVGLIIGAVTSVIGLIPLWLVIGRFVPKDNDPRLAWERDATTLDEARAALKGEGPSLQEQLAANFWPAPRADHQHSHRRAYVGVFVVLALVTALEVLITLIDFGSAATGPLVALSTAKVLLVAMFFMHLRYDSRLYSWLFVYAVPFAALIMIVLALA
jgi:caa(3)-type oxidase subunit IV